jgi:hypothetical protein
MRHAWHAGVAANAVSPADLYIACHTILSRPDRNDKTLGRLQSAASNAKNASLELTVQSTVCARPRSAADSEWRRTEPLTRAPTRSRSRTARDGPARSGVWRCGIFRYMSYACATALHFAGLFCWISLSSCAYPPKPVAAPHAAHESKPVVPRLNFPPVWPCAVPRRAPERLWVRSERSAAPLGPGGWKLPLPSS